MDDCVFCKIINGEIPTKFEYQDENIVVFPDINPQAEIHLLIVSKKHILEFATIGPEDKIVWDEMINQASLLIKKYGLENRGYRLVLNGGGAALVNHLHLHLLGGITVQRKV
ncbi:MAG: HIT domain-containing protein [Patescibacteria group bacterium]